MHQPRADDMVLRAFGSLQIYYISEAKHHQHVVNIFLADLERVRLDPIAFKSDRLIELLRWKLGGGYERDLFDASNLARAADDLQHQRLPCALPSFARADVNTPYMSLVAFFLIEATEKAGRTGETAIGKTTNYEITDRKSTRLNSSHGYI